MKFIAWAVTAIVVILGIIAWALPLKWHIFGTSIYLLFPIFGLVAFSLMWAQYINSAVRQYLGLESSVLQQYTNVIGYLVLVAILLHPGLLIYQLWRNGFGLPPGSYLHYVLPNLKAFVILGSINLVVLLLFELRRVLAKYSWWHYYTYLIDIAMFSIFYHALKLGTQIQGGWYRKVWFFYGISLLVAILYIYKKRFLFKQTIKADK